MKHTGWRKPTPNLGVAEKFAPYIGSSITEILESTGIVLENGKGRHASLVRAMLGVKKRKIELLR